MCGILGTFNLPDLDVAARLELIAHRGPDGSGVASLGPATHGHVRLALVDLTDASAQPFRFGKSLMTFNGEVWNHRELRAALEKERGVKFETAGDTEVLAAVMHEWGLEGLSRVEGMFAFAWSMGDRHLLVRDRFGKIPLHVHRNAQGFAWSSERKGLPGLRTMALPPGHALNLASGALVAWYSLPAVKPRGGAKPLMGELLDGVRLRLQADAPLCVLISGGLDSSIILSAAKRLKPDVVAYTAKLDDGSADLRAARRLCAELEVRLVEVPVPAPTASSLAQAVRAIETSSKAQVEIAALCIPLARAIAADGFKACLSGEGADELFGGYGSMCIKGAKADDAGWREIRVGQLDKMARGNFVRCNKAFMAAGVECRLPFLHRPFVERVINLSKAECPPAKKALKKAAAGVVPAWVICRVKETFQGASGLADAAARAVSNPTRFYNAELTSAFGNLDG